MKKSAFALVVLVGLSVASAAVPFRYTGTGVGAHIGLAVPDGVVDAAFDMGGHADIMVSLGQAGEVHYMPGVAFWIGGDRSTRTISDVIYTNRTREVEVDFNVADFCYVFPLPLKAVRPYVGLGPMFYFWRRTHTELRESATNGTIYYDSEYHYDDVEIGFNFFGGATFVVNPAVQPFVEMRGKFGYWDVFKLSGGLTFMISGSRP